MAGNESLFELRAASGFTRDGVAKNLNDAMGTDDRDKNAVVATVTPKAVRNWELGLSDPVLTPKQMRALIALYKLDGIPDLIRASQRSKKEGKDYMEKRQAS